MAENLSPGQIPRLPEYIERRAARVGGFSAYGLRLAYSHFAEFGRRDWRSRGALQRRQVRPMREIGREGDRGWVMGRGLGVYESQSRAGRRQVCASARNG